MQIVLKYIITSSSFFILSFITFFNKQKFQVHSLSFSCGFSVVITVLVFFYFGPIKVAATWIVPHLGPLLAPRVLCC